MSNICKYSSNPRRNTSNNRQPLALFLMEADILGPFPKITGSRKFVIVAVDHFSKWAKALKIFLSSPPLLNSPVESEVLFLYLFVTQEMLSSVLV